MRFLGGCLIKCADRRNKLEPVVTLHHFVHPLWFDALGGFTTDAGIPHFVSFATFAVRCAAARRPVARPHSGLGRNQALTVSPSAVFSLWNMAVWRGALERNIAILCRQAFPHLQRTGAEHVCARRAGSLARRLRCGPRSTRPT